MVPGEMSASSPIADVRQARTKSPLSAKSGPNYSVPCGSISRHVADALIKRGIAARRLQTAGLGSSQPKDDNSTLQGRALNRRVELVRTDR